MVIGTVSMITSQSMAQSAANLIVVKPAMNTRVESGTQMTDMMKNLSLEPNSGQHIDVNA